MRNTRNMRKIKSMHKNEITVFIENHKKFIKCSTDIISILYYIIYHITYHIVYYIVYYIIHDIIHYTLYTI